MIIDQQHRRRKKRISNVNQYFSSNNILPSTTSYYDNSKPYNELDSFMYGYKKQFIVRILTSFVMVWLFFIVFVDKVNVEDINGDDVRSTHTYSNRRPTTVNIESNDFHSNDTKQLHDEIKNSNRQKQDNNAHKPQLQEEQLDVANNNHSNKNNNNSHNEYEKPKIINQTNDFYSKSKAAFIIVATKYLSDPIESMTNAIESIFKNTDRERILCIVPVFSHSLLIEYGLRPTEIREYFEKDLNDYYLKDGMYSNNSSGDSADGDEKDKVKEGRKRSNFRGTSIIGGKKNDRTIINNNSIETNQKKIKLIIEDDNNEFENGNDKHSISSSTTRNGVAQSRRNAAQFIQILHEEETRQNQNQGNNEEVVLTLLRPDSEIHKHDWLDIVSDALLGPIPIHSQDNESFHYQNAISFALSQKTRLQQHMADRKNKHHPHYHHHYNQRYLFDHLHNSKSSRYTTTSLDINLMPVHTTTPLKSDIELTNGRSYPSPILEGSATSLLLSTFMELNSNLNLQQSNKHLTSTVAADIELSLNLWLCGSGIDIISDLHVEKNVMLMQKERDYVREEEKMWLIYQWMSTDDEIIKFGMENKTIVEDVGETILGVRNPSTNHILNSTSSTVMSSFTTGSKLLQRLNNTKNVIDSFFLEHKDEITSQRDKLKKCRTFDWWMQEVNIFMKNQFQVLEKHNKDLDAKMMIVERNTEKHKGQQNKHVVSKRKKTPKKRS